MQTRSDWMKQFGAFALAIALAACGGGANEHTAEGQHGESNAEFERGPHRGRMLRDGDFAVELAIFERGVPPEFHAWVSQDGEPVPPAEVQLEVVVILLLFRFSILQVS